MGKTDIEAKIFDKGTITMDMFGFAFYRQFKYKMVTHARVFSLKPKFNVSKRQGLFLVNSFCFMNKKFGYENMCSWEKIKFEQIQLPVKNNEIDFDFMESFIEELENERIEELSTYLTVSGLENYELSDKEEKAIRDYEKLDFREYDLTDIFDIKNTSSILSSDIIKNSGMTPYLCASADNNAVSTYISYDNKYLERGDCIFIGGKTFVVSYQKNDFYSNDSHNLALYLKNTCKTKLTYLYLVTCIYKSLSHKYSWGNSVSKTKIKKDKIYLPCNNGEPNFEIMDSFITAIQKIVIKDVVLYVDKKMADSKEIIK